VQIKISKIIGYFSLSLTAGIALLSGCGGLGSVLSNTPGASGYGPSIAQLQTAQRIRPACSARLGEAMCLALIAKTNVQPNVAGWAPADFQARYKLPSKTKGAGQIVGIVGAYDNPNVASDLAAYRSNFGLGTANFSKYNQNGEQGNYPAANTGWGIESDLDVDMVSATCPNCTIYLIEANTANGSDLETAEAEAVKLGAHIVSNSWTCYPLSCLRKRYFDTRGVEYLASASDAGSQLGAPAVFDTVAAIGGTQLAKSGSTYGETIWSGSGGGCATGIPKPKWQSIIPKSVCAYRIANDAAAEAGCSPGVAEYDSYGYGGWISVCGTSAASPLLAGVFGLAGNATSQVGGRTFWLTTHHKHLYKITGPCTYKLGQYTTCAGWGSPNGIGAF
jgi:subtilase family serine protease